MSLFKNASQNDSKDLAAQVKLKAAPKGMFVGTFLGMGFKPASQDSGGGMSFMFKALSLEKPLWINGNPSDRHKWGEINKNNTIWEARSAGMFRTIEFIEVLYLLGCLGQFESEEELADGDKIGDWYYKHPLRGIIGKVAIQFNYSEHNGKSVRNIRKSNIVEYTDEDTSKLQLNGGRELQQMLYSIPKDCVSWVIDQLKSQELVRLDSDAYRLRIETFKEVDETARGGNEEIRMIVTSWKLDEQAKTDGLRTYLKFSGSRESDIMLLQGLQQIVGTDPTKLLGQYFDAMIMKGESTRGDASFSWNFIQDIYPVDKTITRDGLPTGEYVAKLTQPTSIPKPIPSESPTVVQAQDESEDDVTLDDGPFADD